MICRSILSLFVAMFFAQIFAQQKEFINIDINDYASVDSIPMRIEEIPLDGISDQQIDVQLLYPEYVALSPEEKKRFAHYLQMHVREDDFRLSYWESNNRKRKSFSISFSPIVKHNGLWVRLRSCKLQITKQSKPNKSPNNDINSTRWTNQSVLSQGKWAKIRVSSEGIYELTPTFLANLGFTNIDRVKVYGYGGWIQDENFDFINNDPLQHITAAPDDLVEIPTFRRPSGLLFWANGTLRWNYQTNSQKWLQQQNHYSSYAYYFLTEGEAPLSIEKLSLPTISPIDTLMSVPFAALLDEEKEGWYEGGRRLFDGYNFKQGNNHIFRVEVPDIADTQRNNPIEISFSASSLTTETLAQITLNGTNLGQIRVNAINTIYETARATTASFNRPLREGTNEFSFVTTAGNDARLDYIRLNYQRQLRVNTKPYSFSPQISSPAVQLNISAANEQTQLWRIGQRGSPTASVPLTLNGTIAQGVIDSPKRRFVAFDAGASYPTPESVGRIENQNLHADSGIDMVIIIPQSGKLSAQAHRLATIHEQRDRLRVKVVKAGDIYNEFSSGTPDANAYRRYLKMLYDRATTEADAPRYLLFFGKSPWDARLLSSEWRGASTDDYLLPYESDNSQNSIGTVYSYVTDDFFAMLDDNEGQSLPREKMDLAVGRMVCDTEAEARRLVDKIEEYLNNSSAGAWKNKICILADDGDANEHMEDAEKVVSTIEQTTAERYNLNKIYWDRYNRVAGATGNTYPIVTQLARQQLSEGALLFNYSGHGAPDQISHEKSLVLNDFKTSFSPTMSLWVLASCEIFPFDAQHDNLASSSLLLENGGAIAFMCASRAVYATQNNAINRAFMRHVLSTDSTGKRITMGEALRLAKIDLITQQSDLSINKHKYVLFGDPALALAFPTDRVVLDSINGQVLNNATKYQLCAGQIVRFSGYVCQHNTEKQIDESFSGLLNAEIFDRKETVRCKDNDGSAAKARKTPLEFSDQSRSIFKGEYAISNGRFSFTMIIPRDISYTTDAARLSLYALSSDKQREGHGISQDFYLNGTSSTALTDTIAPKIFAYVGSPDLPDRGVITNNSYFVAKISDDSGINILGTTPGHDLELILDGNTADPIVLNKYFTYDFGSYQKGQILYPLANLSLGEHSLTFRAWDVNNNSSTTTLRFVVTDQMQAETNVLATQNPANISTTFITSLRTAEQIDSQLKFEIYNTGGQLVWRYQKTLAAGVTSDVQSWNLSGNNGSILPEGIYHYRAIISNANGQKVSTAQKLIIKKS